MIRSVVVMIRSVVVMIRSLVPNWTSSPMCTIEKWSLFKAGFQRLYSTRQISDPCTFRTRDDSVGDDFHGLIVNFMDF